ncbi:MAG TPA: hypothetical protein PK762_00690 [Candidatus Kapabacteria bacterium]|nr:hypothetical protein [Candidatus Kapabacteria bacterium]
MKKIIFTCLAFLLFFCCYCGLTAEDNSVFLYSGKYAEIRFNTDSKLFALNLFPLLKIHDIEFGNGLEDTKPSSFTISSANINNSFFYREIQKLNKISYLETISYDIETPTAYLSYISFLEDTLDYSFSFEIDFNLLNIENFEKEIEYSYDKSLNAILINYLKYQKSYAIGTNIHLKDVKFEKKDNNSVKAICTFKPKKDEKINFVFSQLNFKGNFIQSVEKFNKYKENPVTILKNTSNYWEKYLDSTFTIVTPIKIFNEKRTKAFIKKRSLDLLNISITEASDLGFNYNNPVDLNSDDSLLINFPIKNIIDIDSISEDNIKVSTFFPADWDSTIIKNYQFGKDKIIFKMLKLPERTRFYFEKHDTTHLKIDFKPLYPFGTIFGTAVINGVPYKPNVEETEDGLIPHFPILLRAVTVIDVYHTKGISVLPLNTFYFSDVYEPYKIVETSFKDHIYTIKLEGTESFDFEFNVWCKDFEIENIENAKLKKQENNVYTLGTTFPGSDEGVSQVEIRIKVK